MSKLTELKDPVDREGLWAYGPMETPPPRKFNDNKVMSMQYLEMLDHSRKIIIIII